MHDCTLITYSIRKFDSIRIITYNLTQIRKYITFEIERYFGIIIQIHQFITNE